MSNRDKLITAIARLKKRGQHLADNGGTDKQIRFYQQILDDITDYHNGTETYIHELQAEQWNLTDIVRHQEDHITRLEAILLIHGFSQIEIDHWLTWTTAELQHQVKQCYQDRFFFAPCVHRTANK